MGNNDLGQRQLPQRDIERALALHIQCAGGFIQQEELRPLVERAGQQDALALQLNGLVHGLPWQDQVQQVLQAGSPQVVQASA